VSLNQLTAAWTAALQEKSREVEQIRTDIRAETAKIQPDPATLGGYYVRLESVCRAATAGRADLVQKSRAVLNSSQSGRLQALDDALALMPRVVEAQRVGLLPDSIETSPI